MVRTRFILQVAVEPVNSIRSYDNTKNFNMITSGLSEHKDCQIIAYIQSSISRIHTTPLTIYQGFK